MCIIYIYIHICIYIYVNIIHIYHPKQMKHMPEPWQIFPFPGSDRLPPLATPASHVLAHRSASPHASESEFVAVAGEMWWKIPGNLNHLGLWSLKMDRNGSPCCFSSWEFYIFLWPIFIKNRQWTFSRLGMEMWKSPQWEKWWISGTGYMTCSTGRISTPWIKYMII